jgi:hypothetical protein
VQVVEVDQERFDHLVFGVAQRAGEGADGGLPGSRLIREPGLKQ